MWNVCVSFREVPTKKKEELSDNNLWIIRCLSEKKKIDVVRAFLKIIDKLLAEIGN